MFDFMGKTLETPVIASSCIATESVRSILRLLMNGVQGIIMKSCADYERSETSDTRQFAVDKSGFVYASSPFEKEILTLEECLVMLSKLRKKTDVLLIPSFTTASLEPSDWLGPCQRLAECGADGIQLDFFYMGDLIGTDNFRQRISALLRELVNGLDVPVMPKLNINLPKDFIIPILAEAGVEYVSLLDSVRSPFFMEQDGKYSVCGRLDPQTTSCFGHWQLPLTLGYTYTASQHGLKVCAGGGVTNTDDVKKLLAAGAVTVQSASFLTKYPDKVFELYPDISTETLPPKGGSVSVRCVAGQPKGFA